MGWLVSRFSCCDLLALSWNTAGGGDCKWGVENIWALISGRNWRFGPIFWQNIKVNWLKIEDWSKRMKNGSGKHAKKTTFSKNGPAQIRKSQNVLPQMENSWDGSATNEEFPKWATTNQELLKCDSGFVVAHFKNSSFVAPLFGNSHFVAGSLKEFSICEKAWSKTVIPVWNKGSNIFHPHIWSRRRLLNKW